MENKPTTCTNKINIKSKSTKKKYHKLSLNKTDETNETTVCPNKVNIKRKQVKKNQQLPLRAKTASKYRIKV